MTLAARLWADNGDLAKAALEHPFVRGLADGTLPQDTFAGYIAQDAFYLDCFARAYALALAHSPDRPTLHAFADLLAGVRDELRLHSSTAERLGIDLSAVRPNPATLAYTDFLLGTAALGSVGLTCAAMTPCLRLYAYLGTSLAGQAADGYTEWITTYADPDVEGLATRLEDLLDKHAPDTDQVHRAYRRAMALEVDFFDAAYRAGDPVGGSARAGSALS